MASVPFRVEARSLKAVLASVPKNSVPVLEIKDCNAFVSARVGQGVVARRVFAVITDDCPDDTRFGLPPAVGKLATAAVNSGADWVELGHDWDPAWHAPLEYRRDCLGAKIIGSRHGITSWFLLASPNAAEVPAVPEGGVSRLVSASDLAIALDRAFACTSADEHRYALADVRVELGPDCVRVVGCDGHRLAVQRLEHRGRQGDGDAAALVSPEAVKAFKALLKSSQGREVWLSVTPGGWVVLRDRDDIAAFPGSPGRFPRWEDTVPGRSADVSRCHVDAAAFARVTDSVQRQTKGSEATGVAVAVAGDVMEIGTRGEDAGPTFHVVPVGGPDSPPCGFYASADYLADLGRMVKGRQVTLSMGFEDYKKAVRFETGDGLVYVMMPKTLDKDTGMPKVRSKVQPVPQSVPPVPVRSPVAPRVTRDPVRTRPPVPVASPAPVPTRPRVYTPSPLANGQKPYPCVVPAEPLDWSWAGEPVNRSRRGLVTV